MARKTKTVEPLGTIRRADDERWAVVAGVLAESDPPHRGHRPRIDPRRALDGIVYHLRAGCRWAAPPARSSATTARCAARCSGGPPAACSDRLWGTLVNARATTSTTRGGLGVAELRLRHDQGPARGDQVGPNPTDRAKAGTKRGVPTEGDGGPLAVVVAPANRHDALLLGDGLERVAAEPPRPLREAGQHLCLDKAFDGTPSDATARVYGHEPHVRRIGEEKLDAASGETRCPARRWVVERTISWPNRCRAILVRWAKRSENYLALNKLACALLWYRRLYRLRN